MSKQIIIQGVEHGSWRWSIQILLYSINQKPNRITINYERYYYMIENSIILKEINLPLDMQNLHMENYNIFENILKD